MKEKFNLMQLLKLTFTLAMCFGVTVAFAQPANDACANAEVFGAGGGAGVISGTTVGADTDATPFCGTGSTSPGVFYTFTAGDDGDATLDLCGAGFDSKMSVYTGDCAALDCVLGEDDDFGNCGGNDPSLTFAVTAGTVYTVHVHGFGGGNGPFDMNFDLPLEAAPPAACALTCPAPVTAANPFNDCGVELTVPNPDVTDGCVIAVPSATLTLDLTTDDFAGETTWSLTDDADGSVIASNGALTSATTTSEEIAVPLGGSYTFTINDSFGDGICCGFGNGSYALSLEGVEIPTATGGQFTTSEATSFETAPAPAPVLVSNDFNGGADITNETFPIGTTDIVFTAMDADGNISTCNTSVTVDDVDFQPGSITCLSEGGQVSLSAEFCDAEVTSDDLLQGINNGCADNYTVGLFADAALTQPLASSPVLTSQHVGQTIYAMVTSPTGNTCWTSVIVEDKLIPELECNDFTATCTDDITPGASNPVAPVLTLEVIADDFGGETSWELVDDSNGAVLASAEEGTVINNSETSLEIALSPDKSYTFTINDSFGDGICCGFGMGSYSLSVNGVEVASGAEFADTESATFTTPSAADAATAAVAFPLPAGAFISPADIANGQPYTVIGFDPCGPVTLTYVDEDEAGDCTADAYITRITRTWTAVDPSGNETSCSETIDILRSTIGDVAFPENRDGLELPYFQCDASFATDANGHPHPSVSGYPTINGEDLTSGDACDFGVSYEDQRIDICEGTYKVIRTWTVLAWCPTTDIANDIQVIKVVDDEGPSIAGLSDQSISTGQNDCTASAIIQTPALSDNCSPAGLSYSVAVSQGTLNAAGTAVFGLPLGNTTVTITAIDGCGNESEDSYIITVEDLVPPVAICESFHTVGLTIDEPTLVAALVFDDGSYDNCELVEYSVRRMDNPNCPGFDGTPFGEYAPFYCCDVAGPNVMVELRVRDASGNTNSCMVEVEVQDKLNPAIACPANVILDCYEDPYDLEITGEATATDNCSVSVSFFNNGSLDNCGEGTVFRIWTATDAGGRTASCVQRIDVINSEPFDICDTRPWNTPFFGCDLHSNTDGVEWPADIELNTCGAGLSPDELEGVVNPFNVRPRIFEDGCDLVGVTYEDVELPIQPDACVKIIRNWKVYDWCTFDADNFDPNNPTASEGYWEYVQIIKVLTTEAPTITSDCEDISFCSYDDDCANGQAELTLDATDDCTPADDLNYYYWIDLGNDGSDEIHASGNNASGTYPLGTHSILWHVEDGCGNVSICEYLFVISDCKKPTPYAYNGLAIDIMPLPSNSQVELWASDFDAGSFDNCGIEEFRLVSPSQGPGQVAPPVGSTDFVTFYCDDLGTNTVDLWVKDINGNWDYVSTYVLVQDNMNACIDGQAASIAGTIENEEAADVEEVMVDIDGDVPGIPDGMMTGATGSYAFPGLANGANYTVTPSKDVDPLNGVTTFDLVLMSKHILGIQNLDSPYKMIAADVNKSGSITTFDMVELRKLILFIDTEFQSNTSWRFVDADFAFPNATNPFATTFPEIFSVNGLNGEVEGDFVAVKVGDVNCSAQVNPFAGSSDDRNANGDLVFGIEDQKLVAGETYSVDFTAADFANVLGYQFTLAFDNDAVEFVDVETSLEGLTVDNFGMNMISEGVITTSWNNQTAVSLDKEETVFTMTFVAKNNTQLSEVLAVNSRYTKAEGYDNDVNLMNIGLSFNGATTVSGEFELYQNQPNPFKSETVIGFNLVEAGSATLTVYDVSGKVLKVYSAEYAQGYNEVAINRSELSGAGVLYYQLDTENDSATKKMILIK